MGNRKTEDERIERVIRGLLKLPENRRCINCNLLGPQYVCTTFSTFVCTNCSGIHREFTHRVKSVSMAKFTADEVSALQEGGNEKAKQIYFKEWDPLRHSNPDSCNIPKLRDFIKNVYAERRYTGERGGNNLPKINLKDKEESYGIRKSNSFGFELKSSQSLPSRKSDNTSFRYPYDESRSPNYTQKISQQRGYTRSPAKFEVVDDRFRDDDHRIHRLSSIESKLKQISIDGHKNVNRSQHDNASSTRVTLSGGEGSAEENPSNNPESSNNLSTKSQASEVGPKTPDISQSNESNWAIFETSTEDNDPKNQNTNNLKPSTTEAVSEAAPVAKNPLDLLLMELSSPVAPMTSDMSQVTSGDNNDPKATTEEKNAYAWDFPPTSTGQTNTPPNNAGACSFTSTNAAELAQSSDEVPPQTEPYDVEDFNKHSHAQKSSSMQYLPSISAGFNSVIQPTDSLVKDVASNNQLQPQVAPNTNDTSSAFTELSSQTTSKPTQETRPNVGSQPDQVETRSSGRKELPEDLFTSSYLSSPASVPGWQNVQPHGIGYGMQYYPNAMPPSTLPFAPMSINPFDATEGRSLTHVSSLPSMGALNGVLPGVSPKTGLTHVSSLGSFGTMMSQPPSYGSPVPMSGYFDQVNNEEKSTRPKRADSFNGDLTSFGSINTIQQSLRGYETSNTPNSFSNTRGNPFD